MYLDPVETAAAAAPGLHRHRGAVGCEPEVVADLVAAGAAVLTETPPAPDLAALRALWAEVGGTRRVQVAEQYLLLPGHAARLGLVRGGVIGTPTSVQVSSTHGYHAVSMIRGFLDVAADR